MMYFFTKQPRYANIPYTPLADHSVYHRRWSWASKLLLALVVIIVAALLSVWLLHNPRLGHPERPDFVLVIPEQFPVVALVFYGRRSMVEILHHYLKVFAPFIFQSPRSRGWHIVSKTSRKMEACWTRLSFSFGPTMSTISNTWIRSSRRLQDIAGMISSAG